MGKPGATFIISSCVRVRSPFVAIAGKITSRFLIWTCMAVVRTSQHWVAPPFHCIVRAFLAIRRDSKLLSHRVSRFVLHRDHLSHSCSQVEGFQRNSTHFRLLPWPCEAKTAIPFSCRHSKKSRIDSSAILLLTVMCLLLGVTTNRASKVTESIPSTLLIGIMLNRID